MAVRPLNLYTNSDIDELAEHKQMVQSREKSHNIVLVPADAANSPAGQPRSTSMNHGMQGSAVVTAEAASRGQLGDSGLAHSAEQSADLAGAAMST